MDDNSGCGTYIAVVGFLLTVFLIIDVITISARRNLGEETTRSIGYVFAVIFVLAILYFACKGDKNKKDDGKNIQ